MTLGTGAANIEGILFQIGSQRYLLFDFNGTDVTGWTPQLTVSEYAGARNNDISLTIGNGLSYPIYETDQILASFSEANTSIQDKDYYLELRRRDLDLPIFSTKARFSYDSPQGDAQELSFTNESQTISVTLGNQIVSGSSGSVTSFSSGNLSPLFTTSVADPTSTPALTFTLSTQAANTVFAGPTIGGAAMPTFRALVAADIPSLPYWSFASGGTLTGPNDVILNGNTLQFSTGTGFLNIKSTLSGSNEFGVKFTDENDVDYVTIGGISTGDDSPAVKLIGVSRSKSPELALVQDDATDGLRSYGWYMLADATTSNFSLTIRRGTGSGSFTDTKMLTIANASGNAVNWTIETMTMTRGTSGVSNFSIVNSQAGTGNGAQVTFTLSGDGSNAANIQKYGSAKAAYKNLASAGFNFLAATGSINMLVDAASGGFSWGVNANSTASMVLASTGRLFVGGNTTPTAVVHLAAGTSSASTAPLKFTTGTVNTTAEAGAFEYNNTPHFTNSDATRRHLVLAPNTTKVTAGAPYANDGYVVVNIGGTDFKMMTTA